MRLIASIDERLRNRAMPVRRVRRDTRTVFDQMIECMERNNGMGLAAPQVGIMYRLFVMRAPNIICLADPVITAASANFDISDEGCLSFPDSRLCVKRHARVTVQYRDYHNQQREGEFHGVAAVCIQHEIDHLDGITFYARAYQQGLLLKDSIGAVAEPEGRSA